jgi:glutamyl-tRNA synthetase
LIPNRYFFVWNPNALSIKGVKRLEGHAPLHPDHPERGIRKMILEGENGVTVLVTEDDMKKIDTGTKFRLKDLCNVKIISEKEAEYIGDDLSIIKEGVKIIHWIGEAGIPTKLYMPDGTVKEGLSERIMENDMGKVVQFERMGFVRIEEKDGEYEAYFAHR